ncbi:MAG: AAA family ATPase [Nitriliruptorales bacterium]|nr:AAA family ATPase [Nitriliruptorales bacterium]
MTSPPDSPTDPIAGLNPAQRAAAEAVQGPVRILAGAGTGKTRTITHRIAHQIRSGVARPGQILAVTFTDRAAGELRTRLGALGVPPVRAATFHAAAWAQLRHFWPRAADAPDQPLPEVMSSKIRLLVPFARRLGVEARDLAGEIEWAKARMLSPEEYRRAAAGRDAPVDPDTMAEVYAAYEAAKAAAGAIDYEDMLLRTADLLVRDGETAAAVRDRYRFLTVDEYQDVNRAQHALLRAWIGERDELCVVGDDDQTIYSFTGASSRYLIDFHCEFPHAQRITLTRNYRSTRKVLTLANRVLWTKPAERRKRLTSELTGGPEPEFTEFAEAADEVAGVVSRCRALLDDGVPAREIAVLYRVNAQSEAFELALRDAGLPFTVRGEATFFARTEVRQALRLLTAERERPSEDPAAMAAGVELTPPPADRRVERVLRAGLRHQSHAEPAGGVARERWRNLEALIGAARSRMAGDPQVSFESVVDDLLARAAAGADAPGPGGAITLATLHRAKGLEFDAVFLASCEEGLLPISHARTDEEVEEERRLLYVGVTRARRHLWLSWALSRPGRGGRAQRRRPSRLLFNLAEGAPRSGGGTARDGAAAASGNHRSGRGSRERASPLRDLSGAEAALAERLRAWRAQRARQDEVPAFVVCSDRTLAALATADKPPAAPEDLLSVHGLGPAKLERYGEELLQVMRDGHARR